MLPDPWSPGKSRPYLTNQGLHERTRALLTTISDIGLVAGLLNQATIFVGLMQAMNFVERTTRRIFNDRDESFEDLREALDALRMTDGTIATALRESRETNITELSLLRAFGFLTSDESLLIQTHPLLFASAVSQITEDERVYGSLRLDGLARLYAAHLFDLATTRSSRPVRRDLQVSCLLYCARRGLYHSANILLGTLPALEVAYRPMAVGSLGHQLRSSLLKRIGRRPGPEHTQARWLWMSSFSWTSPSDGGREAFEDELAQVDAELAAGIELDSDLLENLQVMRAALIADSGDTREAQILYQAVVASCSNKQVRARALQGLAKLAIGAHDIATARGYLQQLSELGAESIPGFWNLTLSDTHALESAALTDVGDGWRALARLDEATTRVPVSHDEAAESGRRFHERGVAAASLGQLDEAQRLLDEAVRLKAVAGDDRLLASSYLEHIGLALQRNDAGAAERWLTALNDLRDIPVNDRIAHMVRLLAFADGGLSAAIEVAQQRTVRLLSEAVEKSNKFDVGRLLDWSVNLDNAGRTELAASVLKPVLERRIGDETDYAIAMVFSARAASRRTGVAQPIAPAVITVLRKAVDLDPSVRNLSALAFGLLLSTLPYISKVAPEARDGEATLERSRDALRSAEIFCNLGIKTGNFSHVDLAADMALSISSDWSSNDWRRLIKLLGDIPADSSVWDSEVMAAAVAKSFSGSAALKSEFSESLAQHLDVVLKSKTRDRLCVALLSNIIHFMERTETGWSPGRSVIDVICGIVNDRHLAAESWHLGVSSLALACQKLAESQMVSKVGECADVALSALETRGLWHLGGPVSQCLMYDGILACSSDLNRSLIRAHDIRRLALAGNPQALVSEMFLYKNLLPAITRGGEVESALTMLGDLLVRFRSVEGFSVQGRTELVDLLAEVCNEIPPVRWAQTLQAIISLFADIVGSVTGESLLDHAAHAVFGVGCLAAAADSSAEAFQECEHLFLKWRKGSSVAEAAVQSIRLIERLLDISTSAQQAFHEEIDELLVSARRPDTVSSGEEPADGTTIPELLAIFGLMLVSQPDCAAFEMAKDGLAYMSCSFIASSAPRSTMRAFSVLLLVRIWAGLPDWPASQEFLASHPELVDQEAFEALSATGGRLSPSSSAVHQALLSLAGSPIGISGAYQAVTDQQSLSRYIAAAVAAQDSNVLFACSVLESNVHECAFLGIFHNSLAQLITRPEYQLPESFTNTFARLRSGASMAELNIARMQLDKVPSRIRENSPAFQYLLRTLS